MRPSQSPCLCFAPKSFFELRCHSRIVYSTFHVSISFVACYFAITAGPAQIVLVQLRSRKTIALTKSVDMPYPFPHDGKGALWWLLIVDCKKG